MNSPIQTAVLDHTTTAVGLVLNSRCPIISWNQTEGTLNHPRSKQTIISYDCKEERINTSTTSLIWLYLTNKYNTRMQSNPQYTLLTATIEDIWFEERHIFFREIPWTSDLQVLNQRKRLRAICLKFTLNRNRRRKRKNRDSSVKQYNCITSKQSEKVQNEQTQ